MEEIACRRTHNIFPFSVAIDAPYAMRYCIGASKTCFLSNQRIHADIGCTYERSLSSSCASIGDPTIVQTHLDESGSA
jgi:hypothetical protein